MSHQVESTEPPPAASTTHPEWGAVGILSVTTIPVPSAQSFVGYEVIVHGTGGDDGGAEPPEQLLHTSTSYISVSVLPRFSLKYHLSSVAEVEWQPGGRSVLDPMC